MHEEDLNGKTHLAVDLINQLVSLWNATQGIHLEQTRAWTLQNANSIKIAYGSRIDSQPEAGQTNNEHCPLCHRI
uniref:Uncharacterized protein n=1 Tax=Oryza rufipogon TaxID=4529 RepID=A0A0E0PMF8_ORYRU